MAEAKKTLDYDTTNENYRMGIKDPGYHLVDPSPWPLLASIGFLLITGGAAFFFHDKAHAEYVMLGGLVFLLFIAFRWWKDCIKEGDKYHSSVVQKGLRWGMLLFIMSEVMFFFAFFYSFFFSALDPGGVAIFLIAMVAAVGAFTAAATGFLNDNKMLMNAGIAGFAGLIIFAFLAVNVEKGVFPPAGLKTVDPWGLPLFNTLLLLMSGTTVTWAHAALLNGDRKGLVLGLMATVFLGAIFTVVQAIEYGHILHDYFKFSENNYSSNFFMATGFHGLHVQIGTIFLIICLIRAFRGNMNEKHHLSFEFAAWYWHFVDVVWLFLFMFIYVWGR